MIAYGDYPDLSSVRKILVINLKHHGDVLLSSPVFKLLRQRCPQASIHAYLYAETLPMLDGLPAISGYHLYDRRWKRLNRLARLSSELRLLRQIRAEAYDLVINLTEGDRGLIAAIASGAAIRVGWESQANGASWRKDSLYHYRVRRARLPRHCVEQNLDVLRRIGLFPGTNERELSIAIPDEARQKVNALLSEAGIQSGRFVLFHPTSRWMFKCWPIESVAAVIRTLDQRNIPIVISAAPDSREQQMLEKILELCPQVSLLNLGGKFTLKQLAALIDASACLVGVDSVPMHLAAALKRPVVAVFGPSSEIVWGPWRMPSDSVISLNLPCRPCNLDGCGGGKVSDCLVDLPVRLVLERILVKLEGLMHD